MRVYLAGPMRGLPNFNFLAFHKAAAVLRMRGHHVFSPAERDELIHGPELSTNNLTGCEQMAAAQHGFSLREALGADMAWICAEAEAIALLPKWELSKGARAEYALADALGLDVIYLEPEEC